MVEDYRSGVGSIYDLADIYDVHRNTVAQHLKAQGVKLSGRPMSSTETGGPPQPHDVAPARQAINSIRRSIQQLFWWPYRVLIQTNGHLC